MGSTIIEISWRNTILFFKLSGGTYQPNSCHQERQAFYNFATKISALQIVSSGKDTVFGLHCR